MASHQHDLFDSSQHPWEVGIIIPISQLRKLRLMMESIKYKKTKMGPELQPQHLLPPLASPRLGCCVGVGLSQAGHVGRRALQLWLVGVACLVPRAGGPASFSSDASFRPFLCL